MHFLQLTGEDKTRNKYRVLLSSVEFCNVVPNLFFLSMVTMRANDRRMQNFNLYIVPVPIHSEVVKQKRRFLVQLYMMVT